MTPLKLCYICEATQGGVRKHLRDLFTHFARAESGYAVHALLGDRGETGLKAELDAFVARGNFAYDFIPEFQRAIRLRRDARAYAALKEHLRVLKPDIVHTHSSKAGFLGRSAAHYLSLPRILHTPHVFPFQWADGVRGRVYTALERHAAQYSHTIVCVGDGQREDALKRRICDANKLVVIRNGVRLPDAVTADARVAARTALGVPLDAPLVGMVARLAPQKGVGNFVRAAALVLAAQPAVHFVVVGGDLGGAGEVDVRARMREYNVPAERFLLTGHRADAEELYAAFDVVALSSLYEGLPYVLLEAMARGIPVVATDVLGSHDVVVDGDTGFLAPVNDPARIADRLLRLLEDAQLRARCGEAARRHVKREYGFEAFLSGHEKLYAGE
jgi:glycosyltransferase involved in cell wall biosynthesis